VPAAGDADVLLLGARLGERLGDVVEALDAVDGEDALRAELAVDVVDEDAGRRLRLGGRLGRLGELREGNLRRGGGESGRLQERASFQILLLEGLK
jgi:hypothetical protein